MFHEGQFEGRKVRLPVFLGRRPKEPADMKLRDYYANLLAAIDDPVFRGRRMETLRTYRLAR